MKFSTFKFVIFIIRCCILANAVTNNFLGLNQENSNLELFSPNPFEFLNTASTSLDSLTKPKAAAIKENPTLLPISLKCQICCEVYNNKFDFQIMIEQKNKCQNYENKYSITKETCIYLSKNIAYKFFDNGGDSYFDRDLAQKVKTCRNQESNLENKNINCQKVKGKVCDVLLETNNHECQNLDVLSFNENELNYQKNEEKKELSIRNSNSFMEVNTNLSEVRFKKNSKFIYFNQKF